MFNKLYELLKKILKNNYKLIIFWIVILFLCFYKLPYVIYCPGGAIDLTKRIEVENATDKEGKLQMAYVSMRQGSIINVLLSFVMPSWDLEKESTASYDNQSLEQTLEVEKFQMQNSIDIATILAYQKSGKDVNIKSEKAKVYYITDEAQTDIQLLDEIISVDGIEVKTLNDIVELVKKHQEGDIVNIVVKKDEKLKNVTAKVYLNENLEPKIGIGVITGFEYETNPSINIKHNSSEAGSSGGLMLSLAIYNALVDEDITHGKSIIGTGTISLNGAVGEIDGVKYKVLGAERKNAEIFLCPTENYKEAMEVKNKYNLKIDIVSVSTFDEALDYLNNLN